MPPAGESRDLRMRLLCELAQRLWWSAFSYALFATLFSLNLPSGSRTTALFLSALLAVCGGLRILFSRLVIAGRDIEGNGRRLIRAAETLSLIFGVFVAHEFWQVRGQVVQECYLVIAVAGMTSGGSSVFAPFPRLNRLNAIAQLLPLYWWAGSDALPRYGWLLPCLLLTHAVVIFQTIRMNGAHIRQAFSAQIHLEQQTDELRRARDEANKASQAKSRFLANMSHEIRTPLNGILGLAEVLNHLALTGEQRDVVDDIGNSGRHLLSIVNDVLDIAKVNSGKLELQPAPFNLPQLIREIASPAAALAESRQLRFRLEVPPDLPHEVQGDALRIRQVVSNLLSNAVKFTSAGEVRLAVQSSAPGRIRFAVSDTGIGLTPEQAESLFQEFHQVDSSSTRRFGGSGLGLAISHRLTELMGGELRVESRLNEGSTFSLDLPLDVTPAGAAAAEPNADATELSLPPGLRILVAEDNPVNQRVAAMMLARAGAAVELAENGNVAVERHRAAPYDIILMDCQMPELDGYQATAKIRSLASSAALVPIIGSTANAFAEDRERCMRAGMNGYLAKPLNARSLVTAIAQFAPATSRNLP